MPGNGLRAYGFHAADRGEVARSIRPWSVGPDVDEMTDEAPAPADEESVARRYLDNAFSSNELPELTNPPVNEFRSEFTSSGTDESPLKGTKTFRFTQTVDGVPVYGSLVTVELDTAGELVSINSALGEPQGVS